MADGDNLFIILAKIRADLPDIPDEAWEALKRKLSLNAGGGRVYIPSGRKRNLMEKLDDLDDGLSNRQLAKALGISLTRLKQLKRIR